MLDLKEILDKSKQSLLVLAKQLNTVEIEAFQDFELLSSQFRTMDTLNRATSFLSNIDDSIVYTIELVDIEKRKKLIKLFDIFYAANKLKTKNVDRINHSRYNKGNSETLYVGSSTSDFKSRLKKHLGVQISSRTYAMHLSKWDNDMNYTIRIKTYKIKFPSDKERSIVELIEQQIWDELQPVFGKRSGLL